MRLKKLEVFGFKSFFDKTEIFFRPGINAIVGPNGCGKSNLSDAILWVLGEQSPKNLRGDRMEDVIFNGTEHRKPLAVAEVSLTVGDIAKELPPPYTPYGELTFCRRLYRSGESEYLINKTHCRLKDVRDLLMDMGAGYRAHTIIEQGRVDDLITASPIQRREIVEETAGIAKYRVRKAEALRKLDATEQNLVRVRDIIDEIGRQRSALDRQAKKAEKYGNLRETFKSLELQVAQQEWAELNERKTSLTEEEERLQDIAAQLSSQLAGLELRHTETKLLLTEKDEILGQANITRSELEGKIQRLEGKIETIHAQRKEWLEAQEQSTQEIGVIKEGIALLVEEEKRIDREVTEIVLNLPVKEEGLSAREEEAKQLEETVQSDFDEIEQQKVDQFHLVSLLTTSKNNLIHFHVQKETLLKQKERGGLEQEAVLERLDTSKKSLNRLQTEGVVAIDQLAEKKKVYATAVDLLEKTEAAVQLKEEKRLQLKEELAAAKAETTSRKTFYQGLLDKKEGSENLILQLDGLRGMIADFIEVPHVYERATEAILGTRLQGIVLGDHKEIKKGITLLRQGEMGRGTFFPTQPRSQQQDRSELVAGEGLIGRAIDLISFRKGYEALAEILIGSVCYVKNLDAALALWEKFPKVEAWVTLDGEVIDRSGVISGGQQGEKGFLVQKREIQALSVQIDRLQTEMIRLQAEIDQSKSYCLSTQSEITTMAEEIRGLDLEQIERQNDRKVVSAEVNRLQEELQILILEQEENVNQEEELIRKEEAEQTLIAEKKQLKETLEIALDENQKILNDCRLDLNRLNDEVVQLRMVTASLKEKQNHAIEKQGRVANEIRSLRLREEEKVSLQNVLHEKLDFGKADEEKTVSSIQGLTLERDGLVQTIRKEQEIHAVLLSTIHELDEETGRSRKELSQGQEGLQEIAIKKVEAEMGIQKVDEAVSMNYRVDIASYRSSDDLLPIDEAREKRTSLKTKLDEMGPVNMTAIEEYRELDTRYQFLTTQEADLIQSIEGLREAIAKINKTTRGLFVETFHLLNQKFAEVFVSFFGGGTASLVLLDEAHPLESGIDMIAQLPGKGQRSITLLSGGEKALTAISLLLATFLIHPTPFCLLDEIDAPLDEENTRRFAQTLLKMSNETQFIIVTHNKLSMEIADVLYGVTMEETGISKLVSVNLHRVSSSNGQTTDLPETAPLPTVSL